MFSDDLRTKLKASAENLKTITTFYTGQDIEARLGKVELTTSEEDFWKNEDQIEITKEHQHLKEISRRYSSIVESQDELSGLVDLFENDEEELKNLSREIDTLYRDINKFKIELLLSDKKDSSNCFLTINPGAGGTESQDWASMLLRMFVRFCENQNLKSDIIDYQDGDEAGIKSVTIHIKGKNAFGLLKSEAGIHRLVRISPFDSAKRRHTSFAGVFITPEVEDSQIVISDDDLRIDTYRAGGAGGQHVNKTDSAVRITHLPTNIVVQCQNQRSQMQNKQHAMKQLMAKLVEKKEEEKRKAAGEVEKKKIEWGSQIRSYVLHPYKMIKDHRTNFESPQPDRILDGELMPFIESFLLWK